MLHELNRLGFWPHHLGAYVAAVLIIGLSRVFGLGGAEIGLLGVLALTAVQFGVGYPLQTAGAQIALRALPDRVPFWAQLAIGCIGAAPIAALIGPIFTWILGVTPLGIGPEAGREGVIAAVAARYPTIALGYGVMGTAIWMVFNYSWYNANYGPVGPQVPAEPSPEANSAVAETPTSPGEPAFMRKLPFEKRGTLWAITAEQHYLRVYTDKGDDLILMRFSDALDQLVGVSGLQVHRSHWVARHGVEKIAKEEKRLSIVLKNGVTVPVSRPNITAVNMEFGPA